MAASILHGAVGQRIVKSATESLKEMLINA